jgi:outer membrane cobalamin receptor
MGSACALAQDSSSAQQPSTPQQAAPPLQTTVTVNATLATEAPEAITVLNQQQIEDTPGIELDDRLRQVPGFSLFRRTSSVVANPTTQGVSLRGIGSSGASRTLVLWDGFPVNDAFGGWVYWDRLDPWYIDRVEMDRGAATSVFGDRAMSGTISMFSPAEQHEHVWFDYFGGSEDTQEVSAAYSNLWGRWGASVDARGLTTDGYYITPESRRGRVDQRANVHFATGNVRIDYLGVADRLSIHFDALAEERHNGTLLTHNSSGLGELGATYTHTWTNDQFSGIAYYTEEQFHSTYSSVSLNRNFETLTSIQRVPVQDRGGAAYWQHRAKHWNTIFGGDVDDVHGISYDYSLSTHILTPSGGTLLERGAFAQGDLDFGPVRLFAGIRGEGTGQHGETFVSPNGGIAVGARNFRFRASGYRAFRAPTLNELYRPFRVGNAETLANAALVPENLTGVEAGVDWSRETTQISFSVFRNELNNLIDNATLRTTPTLIVRERENFPSALSRGLEANVTHRWNHWSGQAGYMFVDARLATGARIPLVPKQQGTAMLIYTQNKTMISGGVRVFGLEFDDDLNQFLLPGYAALEMSAEQHITKKLSALASVENLLDRTYVVALTPSPNIGEPRLWRVGLRWSGAIK